MTTKAAEPDRTVIVSRLINAPRALVFAAWTDPRHLARWWGPDGFTTTVTEMRVAAGGPIRLAMRAPDGSVYPCGGVFREVVAPERLVIAGDACEGHPCGGGLPPYALLTITFADEAGGTRLTVDTRFETIAGRSAAVGARYVEGWTDTLAHLAGTLAAA